ncbi:MAG: DEAD/DEAH box helicase [Proteobacteria bacterium]|nr:DEAD/DEAH box helicase [Pseudomonadota bacterium]
MRDACTSHVWSQGAKLVRGGAVSGVSEDTDEIEIKVHAPGFLIDPTVVLYLEDEDWECDCQAKDDNCSHVAAAVIALKQAREQGSRLPLSSVERARIEYRFSHTGSGLSLQRYIITKDKKEELLKTPLMLGVTNRSFAFGFRPSQEDLAVDQIIGRIFPRPAPMHTSMTTRILQVLKGATNIFLDGEQVTISDEPLTPKVTVKNHQSDGVQLEVAQKMEVSEIVADGIALCGNTLYEIGETNLSGLRLEKLPQTIVYKKPMLAEFTAEILPNLQENIEVEINTDRLPRISKLLRPRLLMGMDQQADVLTVLPQLVYGTPPNVRIEKGKMIYLEGAVPVRDKQAERQLSDKLRDINLVTDRRVSYVAKEAAYFMDRIQKWGRETLDSTQQSFNNLGPLVPIIEVNDDVFNITFEIQNEQDKQSVHLGNERRYANSESVLSAWQEGLGMAPLEGGGWAPIPADWLDRYGFLVSDILQARLEDNKIPTAMIPTLARLCDDLDLPQQPCFNKLAPLLEGFESIPISPLPNDLTATLRPYQRRGIDWLCFLRRAGLGAILADDMGLGKTLQALCAISGRTLVVCPTSVLHNWANEIDKFRTELSYCIFHGPKRKLDHGVEVVLTTYALLRIDSELLQQQNWDCIVLDEAQNIKNSESQVARVAYKLKGDFYLAISGTPIENRLEELWSLFHFCNRGLLGSRSSFKRSYAEPIGMGEQDIANRLQERIRPFVLRRLKQDVAKDLPPRIDQMIYCELEENERQVYDAVRATTSKEVVAKIKTGGGVMAALEALLRLRQSSCHTGLVPGHQAESSSKIELLLDRLGYTIANGHKALVFSQWTSLLDKIEPHLDKASIEYCRLDGTTRNRETVVDEFQNSSGPPVMLISLKAGGTGLNLTAADHVFLMDPWWNPAVEDQAADRTHRIGQDKPVMVYRLVAKDTVEERIAILQTKKRKLVDAALGKADRAVSLTREDLLMLLE